MPCSSGKRPYPTKRDAKRAAKTATSGSGRPLYTYECPRCGKHHLTKKRRRPQRTARTPHLTTEQMAAWACRVIFGAAHG